MYKFINIHQRAKTSFILSNILLKYKFINIHQRAKTCGWVCTTVGSISLSIFIREPKHTCARGQNNPSISLSIFIREPKLNVNAQKTPVCISLSIFIREPKPQHLVDSGRFRQIQHNFIIIPEYLFCQDNFLLHIFPPIKLPLNRTACLL